MEGILDLEIVFDVIENEGHRTDLRLQIYVVALIKSYDTAGIARIAWIPVDRYLVADQSGTFPYLLPLSYEEVSQFNSVF